MSLANKIAELDRLRAENARELLDGGFFTRRLLEQRAIVHRPHSGECDASCRGYFDN